MNRKTLGSVLAIIAVVALVTASFFFQDTTRDHATSVPALKLPRIAPSGMRVYDNRAYGFSFLYPDTLVVDMTDEGQGAATIVLQDIQEETGLQVFVVPYTHTYITQDRFEKDVPSGVRKGEEEVQVAGVRAVAFESADPDLGATREVWIIHGNHLIEITAPLPLQGFMEKVLATWRFE